MAPKSGGIGPSVTGALDKPATNELNLEPGARGPVGTVPVVRFNVEYYLATVAIPPARPEDIFDKSLPTLPAPKPDAAQRYYAFWQHNGTYRGSDGYINIWDGAGPSKVDTNIGQVALVNKNSGQTETVEAGKIELLTLNGGSSGPFFFVFFTNNTYTMKGDWKGGYNTTVSGWHQVSTTWAPGIGIAATSVADGAQARLHIEVRQNNVGDWWVAVDGEWVGYYPRCVNERADCSQGPLYSGAGLGGGATQVTWYGELFDSDSPAPTGTALGSGRFAVDGWRKAAYIRAMAYTPDNKVGYFFDFATPLSVTDANCYSGSSPAGDGTQDWANYFFYGGPGKAAPLCQ